MKTQVSSRLLAGAILLSVIAPSFAQNQGVQVRLNGQPLALSSAPVQLNGRTLLPLRDVFESLGATVQWNAVAQSIAAQSGATQIQLGINNPVAYVNGRNVSLDQPAILIGGRAFVPLRFVAEATGATVDYNAPLQLVSISKAPAFGNGTQIAGLPGDTGYQAPAFNTPNYNAPAVDYTAPIYQAPPVFGSPAPAVQAPIDNFRSVSIPRDSVVPVQLDSAINSSTARVGQTFTASVVSRRLGDSEFPAGTKLEGLITEVRPAQKDQPGVLDLRFQTAILPDNTRVALRGALVSLDTTAISTTGGRLVANGARKDNRLKVIGIGAGAGFILGRVLKTNSTVSTILGAAGGYLYSKTRDEKAQEARLAKNTTLGVRLLRPVQFRDVNDYSNARDVFLRANNRAFDADEYGYDSRVDVSSDDQYDGYTVSNTLPAPAQAGVYDDTIYPDGAEQTNTTDTWNDDFTQTNTGLAQQISIPEGAVVPVRFDREISSATARVGESVSATVDSQQIGDSEFPAGTRLVGRIIEARSQTLTEPGVLDFEFQTAQLPSGERVSLRGELIALDDKGVQPVGGRLVATGTKSKNDRLKVIGIGAAAGFVLGRVLKKDGALPAILGALGGYIFSQKNGDKPRLSEAVIPRDTRIGVRLNEGVGYNDNTYYASRSQFLRLK